MHLQRVALGWVLALPLALAWASGARAQDASDATAVADEEAPPGSGDPWVDAWLADMDRYGATYPQPFIDEVVRYHEAPRALVQALLLERGWSPGDVYQACALADVSGRACRQVADGWPRRSASGWVAVASDLGAEPGSAAFQRLKQGIVDSYRRWGRPIQVDASLAPGNPDLPRMQAPDPAPGADAPGD